MNDPRLGRMFAVSIALWSSAAARADYPSPAQAGFHHCALVYDRAVRGSKELMPLVARMDGGKPASWLFDAFLFLVYSSPRGPDTLTGATIRSDWQYQLDRWFAPGRDLSALDGAVDQAAAEIGPPESKRAVILAIPYLNPNVRDFGDADGDGRSEDLSTPGGRETVLRWYLAEARRRFESAGFRHLKLWGFYWMREDMPSSDEPAVRQAAELVHAQGGRFLWIPYFRASGWDRWRAVGFDVALMQSVYAFTFAHHGEVRRNRLAVMADLARSHGLGAEIECGDIVREPRDRRYFRCYLADGAVNRLGYQAGATAYYLGDDLVEQMLASADLEVRSLYSALADYVRGQAVADPDPVVTWTSAGGGNFTNDSLQNPRPLTSAETRFKEPRAIERLDLFLEDRDTDEPWAGTAQVEVMRPGESTWSAGGWAVRTSADPGDGRWQVFTVPVGQTAAGLRVTLKPMKGGGPLIRSLSPETGATSAIRFHKALYRPYRVEPAPPATYPDDGRKLIDGEIPERGFLQGRSVGWLWTHPAIQFDLGRVRRVSSVTLHCQGGGFGAVNWPAAATVALSAADPPPTALTAAGPFPRGVSWAVSVPVQVDRTRGPGDQDGHLTFSLPQPQRARYVTLLLRSNAWLMATEVEITADGERVARTARYSLSPPPTANVDPKAWADDGKRLTDGVTGAHADTAVLSGWDTGPWRDVTIDLGFAQAVKTVTVWSVGGGLGAIYAPSSVSLEMSLDRSAWRSAGSAAAPRMVEDGRSLAAAPYRIDVPAGSTARYVRVRVNRSQGWAMLSEIEVE